MRGATQSSSHLDLSAARRDGAGESERLSVHGSDGEGDSRIGERS